MRSILHLRSYRSENRDPRSKKRVCIPISLIAVATLIAVSLSIGVVSSQILISSAWAAESSSIVSLRDQEEHIRKMKLKHGGFSGDVEKKIEIADYYYQECCKGGRRKSLYENEAIEAYTWYSMVVLQQVNSELLSTGTKRPKVLATDLRHAERQIKRLIGKFPNLERGPAKWIADRQITQNYSGSMNPEAHYILAMLYKQGIHLTQNNYEAYVWANVAQMLGHPNANATFVENYGKDILVSQIGTAQLEAKLHVQKWQETVKSKGQMTGSAGILGGIFGNRGGASSGIWSTDAQTSRAGTAGGSSQRDLNKDGPSDFNASRSALDRGDSFLAVGDTAKAKASYEKAIANAPRSRSALDASRQLQALALTCSINVDRQLRSQTFNENRVHEEITWRRIQHALKALGYYTENVDGVPGPVTRNAVRAYQRKDLNADETGYLSADQTVELMCAAAEDVRDADSQIQLGIMYARGIGLSCNTAAAHAWFQKAADQGHPTALYNLGLMYLEGFYDKTSRDKAPRKVQNSEMARSFFREAHGRGHPYAQTMLAKVSAGQSPEYTRNSRERIIGCVDYAADDAIERNLVYHQSEIEALYTAVIALPEAVVLADRCTMGRQNYDGKAHSLGSLNVVIEKSNGEYDSKTVTDLSRYEAGKDFRKLADEIARESDVFPETNKKTKAVEFLNYLRQKGQTDEADTDTNMAKMKWLLDQFEMAYEQCPTGSFEKDDFLGIKVRKD